MVFYPGFYLQLAHWVASLPFSHPPSFHSFGSSFLGSSFLFFSLPLLQVDPLSSLISSRPSFPVRIFHLILPSNPNVVYNRQCPDTNFGVVVVNTS